MYLIGTNYPVAYAYSYIHNAWNNSNDNYCLVWLFSGAVPSDFSEIPEEWIKRPNVMAKNSVGHARMRLNRRPSTNADQINEWAHNRTLRDAKGNMYLDTIGKWMIGECTFMMNRTHEGISRYPENGIAALDFSTNQPRIYRERYKYYEDLELADMYNAMSTFYYRRSVDNNSEPFHNYTGMGGGNVPNFPFICEFDSEQTINGFYMRSGNDGLSSGYMVNSITFEPWDSTLNEGAGGWGSEVVVSVRRDASRQYWDFPAPMTTTKIRFRGDNAAGSGWYMSWLQFCSDAEPTTGKDPYDITWALVSHTGSNRSNANFYDYPQYFYQWWENQEKIAQELGYPYMLVDVGEPGDDATLIMNKSRNVEPYDLLHPLHLGINFKDM